MASPVQTVTGKGKSNPLTAGGLLKTMRDLHSRFLPTGHSYSGKENLDVGISASTLQYLTLYDGTKLVLVLGDSHVSKSRGRDGTWTCSEPYETRSSSST